MRKRYQNGSLQELRGFFIARWYEDGRRKARTLGRIGKMTKAKALRELAALVAPVNEREASASAGSAFGDFVRQVYLPFYRRKWKRTTTVTNEERIDHHLVSEFGSRALGTFGRKELQAFLDAKGACGLSFSVVDHLRWDLKQIFDMAVAEGYLARNPATLLYTPRECPRPNATVMTIEEVQRLFSVLDVRERLIAALAVIAGMRPGEIFGLRWSRLDSVYADVRERVYRGDIDTPKTTRSVRFAALSDGLVAAVADWREESAFTKPSDWVFPSERIATPVSRDNCFRRFFRPKLATVGLGWVTFQVMRRTHSTLLKELDVDPHVRAEQMGHTIDVNENTYTRSSLERRRAAVNALEGALGICLSDSKRTTKGAGSLEVVEKDGAGDGTRTHDVQLGNLGDTLISII
jgi:integrase